MIRRHCQIRLAFDLRLPLGHEGERKDDERRFELGILTAVLDHRGDRLDRLESFISRRYRHTGSGSLCPIPCRLRGYHRRKKASVPAAASSGRQ